MDNDFNFIDPDEDEEDFSDYYISYKSDKSSNLKFINKYSNQDLILNEINLQPSVKDIFNKTEQSNLLQQQYHQNENQNDFIDELFNSFDDDNYDDEDSFGNNQQIIQQPVTSSNNTLINNIINNARQYVGGKYISGGHKPENGGFDCSGLLYYVFNKNGIKLPRATFDIFKFGQEVKSLSDVKPGDIICTPGKGYTKKHVKMVSKIENGQIYTIEAKGRKWGIVEGPLTKTNNIVTIRRVIPNNVTYSKSGSKLILKAQNGVKVNNLNRRAMMEFNSMINSPEFEGYRRQKQKEALENSKNKQNSIKIIKHNDHNVTKEDFPDEKSYHAHMARIVPEVEMDNTVVHFKPGTVPPNLPQSTQYYTHRQQAFANQPNDFDNTYVYPVLSSIFTLPLGGPVIKGVSSLGKGAISWLPKLSFSSAYKTGIGLAARPTLGAITADAVLGAATTAPSIYSMFNDGVNFVNTAETALGLTPVFGPMFNSAKSGIENAKSAVDSTLRSYKGATLANELNKSIKNTKFVNTPVYHTTTYMGNDLRPWSNNEWGLHVTPNHNTAQRIASNIPNSHIKEGIFTYTNNTKPIRITDQGSFQRGFGDFDYTGVEQYDFLQSRQAENVVANQKNPSYVYNNMFEKGGDSFAITNPDHSVVFSKNGQVQMEVPLRVGWMNDILPAESQYVYNIKPSGNNFYGFIGEEMVYLRPNKNSFDYKGKSYEFDNHSQYLNELKKLHNEYVNNLSELQKNLYINLNTSYRDPTLVPKYDDIYKLTKERTRDLIDNFYKSDEYQDRFIKQITEHSPPQFLKNPNSKYSPENQYSKFLQNLEKVNDIYDVGIFNKNLTFGSYQYDPSIISLNARAHSYDPNITIHHEFGHGAYSYHNKTDDEWSGVYSVIKNNEDLIGDASKHILKDVNLSDEYREYITDKDELRQRIIPAVEEMFNNGWTVQEAYDKSKALQQAQLKDVFEKDYIIKLLGGMLSLTPLLMNNN